MRFEYEISVKTADGVSAIVGGECELKSIAHIRPVLPCGVIEYVRGKVNIDVSDGEKIFMNGFQTWTYSPEHAKNDRIHGIARLPKLLTDRFSIDRYGDYYFVDYPYKRGVLHGESYCYFRKGDAFRLFASLDERPGYTLFRYEAEKNTLTAERDCAGVRCGGEYAAFDLFCAEGAEDEVFDAWFAAMNIKPRTDRKLAGYSSWYNRYQNIDENSIMHDLDGCKTVLREGDLFQIDDGWEPFVGDWLEPDSRKFPGGMKAAADKIHDAGFLAGLWLAPFVCETKSKLMREHPDWLLKIDGKKWSCGFNWSGFYALDIDNPEVQDYLRRVFDRVRSEWGFDLVKLDFLYGAAPFGTETESRAGRMTHAMEFLREVCGEMLILGCGVPVMPAFGIVDYCRISCDVGLDWENTPLMRIVNRETVSTKHAIANSIFRRELSGRAYGSDPDVFFLRDENIKLTSNEKRLLAEVNAFMGNVFLTSDDPGKYDGAKRAEYDRIRLLMDATDIRVDAGDKVRISYKLDGEEKDLIIEKKL